MFCKPPLGYYPTCFAKQNVDGSEHILCGCLATGQRLAWALARGLLARRSLVLPQIKLGVALGGHTFTALDEDGEVLHGATRLARVVLTETAYLIWVLRCDRVVGDRKPLAGEAEETYVENRWVQALSKWLRSECVLTNKRVAGKRAIPSSVVVATWEKTLQDEERLPADWTSSPGVLVGRPLRVYEPDGG